MTLKETVQNWLRSSLEDPLAKILASNSHLTSTQLETLLIDVLAENLTSKPLKYDEKARLRQTKAAISRGSFNRTLRQAKRNVIQSIYTILLLGYLGALENTSLTPYLEVSNKLRRFAAASRRIASKHEKQSMQLQTINMLREELETTLAQLSSPWTS